MGHDCKIPVTHAMVIVKHNGQQARMRLAEMEGVRVRLVKGEK